MLFYLMQINDDDHGNDDGGEDNTDGVINDTCSNIQVNLDNLTNCKHHIAIVYTSKPNQ